MPIPTHGFDAPPSATGSPYPRPIVQVGDPGAVGPGTWWVNPLTGAEAIRNDANTGWIATSGSGAIPNIGQVLTAGADAAGLKISNLADPTGDQDAATKDYVDDAVALTPVPTLAAVLGVSDDAGGGPIANLADPTNPQDAATRAYVLSSLAGVSSAPTPALMDVFAGSALSALWTVAGYTPSVAVNVATLTASGGPGDTAFVPSASFANCRFVARLTLGGSGSFDGLYVGTVGGDGILATSFHGNLYLWAVSAFGSPSTPSAAGTAPAGNPTWLEVEKRGSVYRARFGAGATFGAVVWDAWLTTTNTFTDSDPLAVGVICTAGGITTLLSDLLVIPLT